MTSISGLLSSAVTTATCPSRLASISAVVPSLLRRLTLAWSPSWGSSAVTTASSPCIHASISAVVPSSPPISLMSKSGNPAFLNAITTSSRPRKAAYKSGLFPIAGLPCSKIHRNVSALFVASHVSSALSRPSLLVPYSRPRSAPQSISTCARSAAASVPCGRRGRWNVWMIASQTATSFSNWDETNTKSCSTLQMSVSKMPT